MKKHIRFRQYGFTLVELMVAVVTIVILASIVVLSYDAYLDNADQANISTSADAYAKSLKAYANEYNAYPKVSSCLPKNSKCCTSNDHDLPTVYCATNTEAAGSHNWVTDSTDTKISQYINNQAPSFPTVDSFTNCTSGFMSNGPCKATSSIPVVGIAYISNVAGSKYTSTEPTLSGKGFLVYYVDTNRTCGSKDVMTLSGYNLTFNVNATYTRQTSTYRECIIGLR